jgi:hypothetical protein
MPFRKIITVYCENLMQQKTTLCAQNEEFIMLKQVVSVATTGL